MKKFFILSSFILVSFVFNFVSAQTTSVKGVIKDGATGETLIGASVLYGEGKGVVTDIDGNFSLDLPNGDYNLTVSFVGYDNQTVKIKATGKPIVLNFTLQNHTLNEVEIVADIAKTRETPVAFSAITPVKIQEELGSRDIPMILNTTPGVYATESGGGSGDARISIRGFSSRNVAVLVDGIPVNDMENGNVYWSNWDGLGDITRSMQVQRGLGASKLAVTSVGGTMNIITRGIEDKMGGAVKQEVGNNGFLKTSFSYNSGMLKNDWGFTVAGSRKTGDGWVDQTWSDSWSYFVKVQKRFGDKHLLTFGANGAPQSHAQRSWRLPVAVLDKAYAEELGIDADAVLKKDHTYAVTNHVQNVVAITGDTTTASMGRTYNPNWGKITRNGVVENISASLNTFHKPLFNLSHYYTINPKAYLSTVAYASFGNGGGTGFNSSSALDRNTAGLFELQSIYDNQTTKINKTYSASETQATRILRSSRNNHQWYGMLSTFNYKISSMFDFTGGVDLRTYKGEHYQEITDLLGGSYYIDQSNASQPKGKKAGDPNLLNSMKRVGDKITFNYDGYVNWGGLFGQLEMKKGRWSVFFTGSFAQTGYKRVDHFAKKDIVLADTTIHTAVAWGDTLFYDGKNYATSVSNSKLFYSGDTTFVVNGKDTTSVVNPTKYTIESTEARVATSDWQWFSTYTIKTGANYNLTEHQNIFANIGYLTMPQPFNNVFVQSAPNKLYNSFDNQSVAALELGYGINYRKFAVNINAYYTSWKNKPLTKGGKYLNDDATFNMFGLSALHKGVELDFIYKIMKKLDFEGAIAFADWRYKGGSSTYVLNQNYELITTLPVYVEDIHVGDAAQTQLTGSFRYQVIKNLYLKPRVTFYGKNYADFLPIDLSIDDKGNSIENIAQDVWRIPNYTLVDFYSGYDFKYQKVKFSFTAGIINLLDVTYITDALSAGPLFDATNSTVFMGQGRRFNTSLRISF